MYIIKPHGEAEEEDNIDANMEGLSGFNRVLERLKD